MDQSAEHHSKGSASYVFISFTVDPLVCCESLDLCNIRYSDILALFGIVHITSKISSLNKLLLNQSAEHHSKGSASHVFIPFTVDPLVCRESLDLYHVSSF